MKKSSKRDNRRGLSSSQFLKLVIGLVVVGLAVVVVIQSRPKKPIADAPSTKIADPNEQSPTASTPIPDGWVNIGGIVRPKTDVELNKAKVDEAGFPTKVLHGFSPPVSPVANKQVEAVFAALNDRTSANAFSSFATAKPFDADAYKADPNAYINEVEPSRVFSPAQPGEGVTVLSPSGSQYHQVVQGESVTLAVKATPGAPVTLTSFQLGQFENELTSITVRANEEGIAQAKFTASGGTINEIQILAAGPLTSGQVKFSVNVQIPN